MIDFGLSRTIKTTNSTNPLDSVVGTPLYVAPEILDEKEYSSSCDVWSAGCLLFYLLSGKEAFDAEDV